jgi:hypothetical protein
MLLRVAIDGRKKVKPRTVCIQPALKLKHRRSHRNFKKFTDLFVGTHGPDPLFTISYFNLESLSQYIKKRLILELAITEAGQIDIGQKIQVVEDRNVVYQPEPFKVYAARLAKFIAERKNEIIGPLDNGRT